MIETSEKLVPPASALRLQQGAPYSFDAEPLPIGIGAARW